MPKLPENFVPLYMRDSYIKEFKSIIKEAEVKNNEITLVLENTAFYPQGGHQVSDTGTIQGKDFVLKVKKVDKNENWVIFHRCELVSGDIKSIKPGIQVLGKIDWERRYHAMKIHTAEHLITAAINKITKVRLEEGYFGPEGGMLSFNRPITCEILFKAEKMVNQVIKQNLPVRRVISSGISKIIIEGFDEKECGGTHVKNTGEIDCFKITSIEKNGKLIKFNVGCRIIEELQDSLNKLLAMGLSELNLKTKNNFPTITNTIKSNLNKLSKTQRQVEIISQMLAFSLLHPERIVEKKIIIGEKIYRLKVIDLHDLNLDALKALKYVTDNLQEQIEDRLFLFRVNPNRALLTFKRSKKMFRLIKEALANKILKHKIKPNNFEGDILLSTSSKELMDKFLDEF